MPTATQRTYGVHAQHEHESHYQDGKNDDVPLLEIAGDNADLAVDKSASAPQMIVNRHIAVSGYCVAYGLLLLLANLAVPKGPCADGPVAYLKIAVATLPLLYSTTLFIGAHTLAKAGTLHKFLYRGSVTAVRHPETDKEIWLMHTGQRAVMQPRTVQLVALSWVLASLCVCGANIGLAYSRPFGGRPGNKYSNSLGGYPGIENTPIPNVTWPANMTKEQVRQKCSAIKFDPGDTTTLNCDIGHQQHPYCTADWLETCTWRPTAEVFPKAVEFFAADYSKPWCVAHSNAMLKWTQSAPLITAEILSLLVAVRALHTISSEDLQNMKAWRFGSSPNALIDRVEHILAAPDLQHASPEIVRTKATIINGLIYALTLTVTFAYMPRILTKAEDPTIVSDVSYSDGRLEDVPAVQFAIVMGFTSTCMSIFNAINLWLSALPSDVTNNRLEKLTKELILICNEDSLCEVEYKEVVAKLESWFQMRRHVFVGSRYEYRALEALLVGDVILFVAMVIGGLAVILPPVITTGDLGGDDGSIALSLPCIMLNMLWLALLSLYIHSWGLIYTAGNEVTTQKRVLSELANSIQGGQIQGFKINDVEMLQSFSYFAKLDERVSVTDHDQPTVFGIKIQPTFKNVILSTGGTVFVSIVLAAAHKFM